jgi:hypothetical protein
MAVKRDVVKEIALKKSRRARHGHRYGLFYARFKPINAAYDHISALPPDDPARAELLKYIPIGLVACLEGYYRQNFKDLIDHGKPFLQNAEHLDEVRIDLKAIVRTRGARISLGDVVAHLLPLSSFDDVNRHMSALIGEDYFARVRKTALGKDSPVLELAVPRVRCALDELFEDRHIFAHEAAPSYAIEDSRALSHWRAALALVLADDTLMNELLPLRQKATPSRAV